MFKLLAVIIGTCVGAATAHWLGGMQALPHDTVYQEVGTIAEITPDHSIVLSVDNALFPEHKVLLHLLDDAQINEQVKLVDKNGLEYSQEISGEKSGIAQWHNGMRAMVLFSERNNEYELQQLNFLSYSSGS